MSLWSSMLPDLILAGVKGTVKVASAVAFPLTDLIVAVALLASMLLGPKPLRVAQVTVVVFLLIRLLATGMGG